MSQSALITGGTGGLGSAVTEAFLDAGWRVVVPWVAEAELERVQRHERLDLVQADLFDPQAAGQAVSRAAGDDDSPLRAVVNLVGGFEQSGRVHETPVEEFERQFRLNLRPTYLVTAAALPHLMRDGGAVVCVGTRAALEPFPGAAGYAASKAAVLTFVRALAREYRDDRVRVNAVLPSVIDTPANRAAMPESEHHKLVPPQRIASVVAFLCSDRSSAINGAEIPV
jgi:NAD(P)-dependent dehydrogenase (short-subunit alcohol dehydrogenase family)